MTNENNMNCAYVVQLPVSYTDNTGYSCAIRCAINEMKYEGDKDYLRGLANSIHIAQPLDLAALRLVLEAAKWAQDTKDAGAFRIHGGDGTEPEAREWNATQDAIAKLEDLTK